MPQNLDSDNPLPTLALDALASKTSTSYRDRLNHWAVVRLSPATQINAVQKNAVQKNIVARFRSRSDAEGHLRFLRSSMPEGNFLVSFDNQKNVEGVG
ncbi:MAG: hypothetical protein KME15_07195 [Drouetiella hepatica Uher 2000/2452]|jgi:hypothetical protein|uniref:Uncharacterized protein n=1 Tax=Drouetiella hepatica Uher 2000/2452 TaxID=904376 RepID=A0A951Q915_9CYAN|nr:hypothetical protein [Drouetiella hepatica Uher 2000/2452]